MTPLQTAAQAILDQHLPTYLDASVTPLRKALADEQAQAANSRIGFLYEELRKAIDEGSESMTHDDALKQIAYWQDKEQAQAVEPVCSQCKGLGYYDEGHENDDGSMSGGNYVDCACNKKDFTQCTTVTNDCLGGCKSLSEHQNYTHPAPPKSFIRERAQLEQEWCDLQKLKEAQQVAVPVPMSGYEISKWWASENGLEDCDMCIHDDFAKVVRAVEAHHKIGAKP